MQLHSAPQIVVRDTPATSEIYESLLRISNGGGEDHVGLGYWLRKQRMRLTISSHRYDTTGEMMGDYPNSVLLSDLVVEFATVEDAERFIGQWF